MKARAIALGVVVIGAAGGALWLAGAAPSTSMGPRTAAPAPTPGRARLGINLAGIEDWNSELPFVDVFRTARPWISQREGEKWGSGPPLDLDADGWVRALPPGVRAEALTLTGLHGHIPTGTYTLLHDGEGTIDLGGGGVSVVERTPGRVLARVDGSGDHVLVRLHATNAANPVRRVRVYMPGFADRDGGDPWNPSFLARWRGVSALRFMDMMATNDSKVRRWADRPVVTDATFTRRGVPAELLVDLANRLGADPWFTLPHLADDDHVRRFAALVARSLAPGRRAYVEYSNEVWNGMFTQHRHAAAEGQRLGFPGNGYEASAAFVARRSVEIFKIWQDVFKGRDRLIRVLPSQAGNPEFGRRILGWEDAYKHADVLAIAPYFGVNVDPATARVAREWSVGQLLDHLEREVLPDTIALMKTNKDLAHRHGLGLVAYEGGQHLVATGGQENDEALVRMLHEANAHPRMGDLYRRYYDGWTSVGGDLFCHYSSVAVWSKWGAWGLLRFHDEPPARSPKFTATAAWARTRGQPMALEPVTAPRAPAPRAPAAPPPR